VNTNSKKEFILDGLGCANCAAKMEDKIKQLNGVSNVSINFMNKTLSMEIDNTIKPKDIVDNVT